MTSMINLAGKRAIRTAGVLACGCVLLSTTGCGYFKNVRDDVMDLGTFAVGAVPPVVREDDNYEGVGPIPPAMGIYLQATDFCHLGALYKMTKDIEWDRRGAGVVKDARGKFGIGPFHHVRIEQEPIAPNRYKDPNSEMVGWHEHMARLGEPWFGIGAKDMIFEPQGYMPLPWDAGPLGIDGSLPWMPYGWQDWETISAEIAFPEPFLLHSGFYIRAGFDPSQLLDLLFSVVGLDLYQDAAYDVCGNLKH